jgi:CHAT domain-containing protein
VPFEALRVRGRYLLERCSVAYLPAASVLRYLEKGVNQRTTPHRLIAFVDPDTDYDGDGHPQMAPLKGARDEVEGIQSLFTEPTVYRGKEATEAACKNNTPGQEVIHLACHGEFFPARPLDSRLYLSRNSAADGLLHVAEIYGIDLRGSRLVALSGCETGRTQVGAGEDPVGIGTAFLQAGAGALLVSLWKVEDKSTSMLMKTFYRNWIVEGEVNRAHSLRKAKLALLKDRAHSAPRYWAAFILIGPR